MSFDDQKYHYFCYFFLFLLLLRTTVPSLSFTPICSSFMSTLFLFSFSHYFFFSFSLSFTFSSSVYLFVIFTPIVEVFEHALANTAGEDLAKILWLKSETSETWLQRRYRASYVMLYYIMLCYVMLYLPPSFQSHHSLTVMSNPHDT
jgi:hypothetical protein